MIRAVTQSVKSSWKALVLTDILFKAIAFILLTPLVSLVFRGFLAVSGRTVLADVDIANFLLHPIGWATLIVVGGASVGLLAIEQSALMTISLAATYQKKLGVLATMRFIAGKMSGILQIATRMVARTLILAAPFIAIGGGIYLSLLTDHDINYYLSEKPPRFWIAVVLIGADLSILAFLLVRCVISWAVAMQLHLFENVPPKQCLATSRERVLGNRKTLAKWIVVWGIANAVVGSVGSGLVVAVGQWFVPRSVSSLWQLVLTLGVVLLLWSAVNVVTNLLATISFAVMQGHVYDRFGRIIAFQLPDIEEAQDGWSLQWTRGRVLSGFVIAVVVAGLVGITAIHSVRLDDDVEITAHRGASGRAPENTMASIVAAIEDQTDWVEIDVQETKDGVVIVAHDSDLKKVSGNGIKIWEATADELRSIDIGSYFDPKFKDERVPTLADVLTACKGKVGVNIELKYYGHNQDLEQRVIDLVEQHEMVNNVVIMSLEADGIRKVKRLRPKWTVGLLTAVAVGDLTRADADFLAVSLKLATRAFIRSAHQKGKAVSVWTVNDTVAMSTMIGRGADNLITDHPDLARRVLAERAAMSPVERILVELAFVFGAVPADSPEQ
jgi:glycerophosphoryl diester phosphodiesterase